jgi:hypothetical protein
MGPIADDGTSLFFSMSLDGGNDVVRCPLGTSCVSPAAPTAVTNGFQGTLMVAYGGYLYMAGSSTLSGNLYVCPTSGCSSPATLHANLLSPTKGLVADQDGVYFTTGTGGYPSDDRVYTCPLTSCGGGARALTNAQASPSIVRTDSKFVYWVNQGAPGDGSTAYATGTASIMRVAK